MSAKNKPQPPKKINVLSSKGNAAKNTSLRPSQPDSKIKRVQQAVSLRAKQLSTPMARPRLNVKVARPVENGFSGTSKGMKMPKGAKINDERRMMKSGNLKRASTWYQSLRDPVQGAGARLPDAVGINTATLQSVQIISVQTNAQGINGLQMISPYVTADPSAVVFVSPGSAGTSTALSWGTTGAVTDTNKAALTLKQVAQSIRVVSCAMFAEYEGATINDSGEGTSYVAPYRYAAGTLAQGGVSSQSYTNYQVNYGSSSVPVNKARSRPLVAYWFPCSLNNWEYTDFIDTDNPNLGFDPVSVTAGVATTNSPYWSLGHVYMGLTSTPSIKYTVVINYEFIPRINTLDYIAASPSPIDQVEEQLVEGWVQEDNQTGLCKNSLVDVQPGAQVTNAATTQGFTIENSFGMFGKVVGELAPMLLSLI